MELLETIQKEVHLNDINMFSSVKFSSVLDVTSRILFHNFLFFLEIVILNKVDWICFPKLFESNNLFVFFSSCPAAVSSKQFMPSNGKIMLFIQTALPKAIFWFNLWNWNFMKKTMNSVVQAEKKFVRKID